MSDWTIPIHTGCSSREDLAFYVDGLMKGTMTAVWLIVERHLAGLDFTAANELVADILVHKQCQFYLRDDSENGCEPCPDCGRLMPPP